jgi:hypothetical protein
MYVREGLNEDCRESDAAPGSVFTLRRGSNLMSPKRCCTQRVRAPGSWCKPLDQKLEMIMFDSLFRTLTEYHAHVADRIGTSGLLDDLDGGYGITSELS